MNVLVQSLSNRPLLLSIGDDISGLVHLGLQILDILKLRERSGYQYFLSVVID